MNLLDVSIVTAEKSLYQGKAKRIVCPGQLGEFEVLCGHAPMLSMLMPGQIVIDQLDDEAYFYVSGGVVEVQSQEVIVLADSGDRAQDLDEAKALEAQRKAQAMLQSQQDNVNFTEVYLELAQAMSQIKVIQKLRMKRGK